MNHLHIVRTKQEKPTVEAESASSKGTQNDERLQERRASQWRDIRYFLIKLAVVLLIAWVTLTQVFGLGKMYGESMYPRLRDGDLLLYYRLQREYHIGDVVLFEQDGTQYVGRIVAMGGDTVNINHADKLIVNGGVQTEEIFYPTSADEAQIELPYTVEENSVFLLCDFRTNGTDSRSYGTVPIQELDGKIIAFFRCRGI